MEYEAPSKYEDKGNYGDLTEAEAAHWNEYTNLRGISDWPGFDTKQDKRRADSKNWLTDRMDYIVDLAEGRVSGETPGWDHANRGLRYDYLFGQNSGKPKHEVRLPCPGGATDTEKVYIEEREVYLVFGSTTDAQKARKQANVDWLVAQRKQVWHLGEDEGWDVNNRDERYDALCIATHYGSAYEEWDKTHNKYGEPYTQESDSQREKIKKWLDKYVGVSENPQGEQHRASATQRLAGPRLRDRRRPLVCLLQCLLLVGQWDQWVRYGWGVEQHRAGQEGSGHLQGVHDGPQQGQAW